MSYRSAETIEEWQFIVNEFFVPLRCSTERSDFRAELRRVDGTTRTALTHLRLNASQADHDHRAAARYTGDDVLMTLQLSAHSVLTQSQRSVTLTPRTAAIYDPRVPYRLDMPESCQEVIVLQFDRRALGLTPGALDAATATRIDTTVPGFPALLALSEALLVDGLGMDPALVHTVEMLAGNALRAVSGHRQNWELGGLLQTIQAYAMERLSAPDLGVEGLARAHFISERTVYVAFAATGDTPAGWLRRQRLERACRLLAETTREVASVAIVCGYTNPSVFSRLFRRRYGMTPSEFRKTYSAGHTLPDRRAGKPHHR